MVHRENLLQTTKMPQSSLHTNLVSLTNIRTCIVYSGRYCKLLILMT